MWGSLNNVKSPTLAAQAITHSTARAGIESSEVADVVLGTVPSTGIGGGNLTCFAALASCLPASVPVQTVDRQGWSRLMAVAMATRKINNEGMEVTAVVTLLPAHVDNRTDEFYMQEVEFLISEGASSTQVYTAVESIGMAMGPYLLMLDMAYIDVGAKAAIEYGKTGCLPPDDSYRALVRRLCEDGRQGQKAGPGYCRYEGRKAFPDPPVTEVAAERGARHYTQRRAAVDATENVERLIFSMVNKAAKVLEEGIAIWGSEIDAGWTTGYGFPDHQGGQLFMADEAGLSRVVERFDHYAKARGSPLAYRTVSLLLRRLATDGKRMSSRPEA